MRLRSRGLGRKELVMDFREYEIVRQGDEVVIVGTIRDPVSWDFTIRFCEDDVPGVTRVMLKRPMLVLLLRSAFRWRRRHHWSRDRREHLVEGKLRSAETRERAAERARAAVELPGDVAQRPARPVGPSPVEGA